VGLKLTVVGENDGIFKSGSTVFILSSKPLGFVSVFVVEEWHIGIYAASAEPASSPVSPYSSP
jgi:hypothetical protein